MRPLSANYPVDPNFLGDVLRPRAEVPESIADVPAQDESNLIVLPSAPNILIPKPEPIILTDKKWQVCGLDIALAGQDEPVPWVVEGLVHEGSATQVSAHPHSMKSLALLQACIEAPARHRVWNHFPAPNVERTVFMESEDTRSIVESRIRGLAKGLGLHSEKDVPGFKYIRTGPFDLVKTRKELQQVIDDLQPDFLVLSTLQSLLGGRNWTEQNAMADVNAMIVELAGKCPMVVITHSPWDKKARRAAGTITQLANYPLALHFKKLDDQFVHVTTDSKLPLDSNDFTLRLDTEGEGKDREVRRIVYHGAGVPKGAKEALVRAAIDDDPEATARDIAKRVGDVSVRYVQKIMKEEREK